MQQRRQRVRRRRSPTALRSPASTSKNTTISPRCDFSRCLAEVEKEGGVLPRGRVREVWKACLDVVEAQTPAAVAVAADGRFRGVELTRALRVAVLCTGGRGEEGARLASSSPLSFVRSVSHLLRSARLRCVRVEACSLLLCFTAIVEASCKISPCLQRLRNELTAAMALFCTDSSVVFWAAKAADIPSWGPNVADSDASQQKHEDCRMVRAPVSDTSAMTEGIVVEEEEEKEEKDLCVGSENILPEVRLKPSPSLSPPHATEAGNQRSTKKNRRILGSHVCPAISRRTGKKAVKRDKILRPSTATNTTLKNLTRMQWQQKNDSSSSGIPETIVHSAPVSEGNLIPANRSSFVSSLKTQVRESSQIKIHKEEPKKPGATLFTAAMTLFSPIIDNSILAPLEEKGMSYEERILELTRILESQATPAHAGKKSCKRGGKGLCPKMLAGSGAAHVQNESRNSGRQQRRRHPTQEINRCCGGKGDAEDAIQANEAQEIGRHARKRSEERTKNEAATKIQAHYRGYWIRKMRVQMDTFLREGYEDEEEIQMESEKRDDGESGAKDHGVHEEEPGSDSSMNYLVGDDSDRETLSSNESDEESVGVESADNWQQQLVNGVVCAVNEATGEVRLSPGNDGSPPFPCIVEEDDVGGMTIIYEVEEEQSTASSTSDGNNSSSRCPELLATG